MQFGKWFIGQPRSILTPVLHMVSASLQLYMDIYTHSCSCTHSFTKSHLAVWTNSVKASLFTDYLVPSLHFWEWFFTLLFLAVKGSRHWHRPVYHHSSGLTYSVRLCNLEDVQYLHNHKWGHRGGKDTSSNVRRSMTEDIVMPNKRSGKFFFFFFDRLLFRKTLWSAGCGARCGNIKWRKNCSK